MPYKNPEHRKANERKNYLRRRTLRIARSRAYALADPEGYKQRMRSYYSTSGRERNYQKQYKIGVSDYDRMLIEQGGKCAICTTNKPGVNRRHFSVDHDHATGKVRGLLCNRCNRNLGWYEAHTYEIGEYIGWPLQYYIIEEFPSDKTLSDKLICGPQPSYHHTKSETQKP